jgi:two-component system, chemotaxis family, chemotaxis protein CheY
MKILIVDDSKAMRLIVRRTLRQAGYGGYEIDEACNGKEALDQVRASRPDLVLSDWNMPEMSGLDLLLAMVSEGLTVPFGFVTSEGTVEMRERAASAGARFLIAKPFTPETVSQALAAILPAA